jgi:hypothetical protein
MQLGKSYQLTASYGSLLQGEWAEADRGLRLDMVHARVFPSCHEGMNRREKRRLDTDRNSVVHHAGLRA